MTPLQLKVLDLVRDHVATFGYAPTIREIEREFGGGLSKIQAAITALVEQGHLTRFPHRARGLAPTNVADLRAVSSAALRLELARRGETVPLFAAQERAAFGAAVSCAVGACRVEVDPGQWFCRADWYLIDSDVREALINAHATARRTKSDADAARYREAFFAAREQAERRRRRVA